MALHAFLWSVRRMLGLSPAQRLFRELRRRGVNFRELDALDAFANTGFLQTRDYHPLVRSLEAWEIDPKLEPELRRNLPGAVVKMTDAIEEITKVDKIFGLIVLDAPENDYGPGGRHSEHFDIFSKIFRVAADSTVVVVNLLPGNDVTTPGKPRGFTEAHLQRRAAFYGTDHPERISVEDMIPAYRRWIEAEGFSLEWYCSRPRTRDGRGHYLAMKVRRSAKDVA